MVKIGTEQKPIVVRVQTIERREYVADICFEHKWYYLIRLDSDKPEDISNLEKALNSLELVQSGKIGRNAPCPCGSGKKYKKCCV